MIKESRAKLVEKHINWKEVYTQKTSFLKEMFADTVGPGSYFRFEGKSDDGVGYYCIIGPARVHHPRAKFFAGVRRLPATYSAGGKYFDSMSSAATYAKETWGVSIPKTLKPYTAAQLYGIGDKIIKWKEINGDSPEKGSEPKENDHNE